MKKRTVCAALAALMALSLAGCSGSDSSSLSDSKPVTEQTSSQPLPVSEGSLGEKLSRVADIYDSGSYTLECTLTSTAFEGTVKIKRAVSGGDIYQLQTEHLGSHGFVTVGGKSYDFDYVCGMYRQTETEPELNIIDTIRRLDLKPIQNRSGSSEEYDTEQYTYTGETYITVMDFYFDKTDGHLVKYVTTYTVEGQDDIIETRTVDRLEKGADESLFNAYFADDLVDFSALSEDEKLGFCRGVCASWGITTDELFNMGISSSELKTIDYETLFRLIYTYGKPHEAADDTSSQTPFEESSSEPEPESNEAPDESTESNSDDSTESVPDNSENESDTADTSAE